MPLAKLPKEEIIGSSKEISDIFRTGTRISGSRISICYKLCHDHCGLRVAFTTSKRIKHAVDRNRLKRLMREAFRLNAQSLRQIVSRKNLGLDIVINASSAHDVREFSLKDIEKDFEKFLEVSKSLSG